MPYCFSRYLCKQKYNMKLMKKMGKRLSKALVMLLMTTSVENANAQAEWNYSYDATGNRTQRTVNNGSSARKKASSNKNLFEDGRINAILDREHNKLKIETLGKSDASVSIFDLTGKELISVVSTSEVYVIDLSSIRRGTYILTVEAEDEKKTCKFTK